VLRSGGGNKSKTLTTKRKRGLDSNYDGDKIPHHCSSLSAHPGSALACFAASVFYGCIYLDGFSAIRRCGRDGLGDLDAVNEIETLFSMAVSQCQSLCACCEMLHGRCSRSLCLNEQLLLRGHVFGLPLTLCDSRDALTMTERKQVARYVTWELGLHVYPLSLGPRQV
jgi:hypothetical protein